jgi:hypothetical protein
MDPGSNEVLWRGSASAEIEEGRGAEERARRIRDALERMFDEYPPE